MAKSLQAQWDAVVGPTGPVSTQANLDALSFRERVNMAAIGAAISIGNEAGTILNHANRVALAKAVTGKPGDWLYPFAQALAAIDLDNASTDAQINTGIATVWNTLAGAL